MIAISRFEAVLGSFGEGPDIGCHGMSVEEAETLNTLPFEPRRGEAEGTLEAPAPLKAPEPLFELAVPLLASVKIICERIEHLNPIAAFLTP
jgi:hypothetical protein